MTSKEIFDMVYDWGRAGIVVDETALAFRDALKEWVVSKEAKELIWESEDDGDFAYDDAVNNEISKMN